MRGSREGDRGSGPPPPSWKWKKYSFFLAILVRIRWKSKSYQASIQCLAIIGPFPSAKRHWNGVSLAGQWWTALSAFWIVFPLIKKEQKKNVRRCQSLAKLPGSAHGGLYGWCACGPDDCTWRLTTYWFFIRSHLLLFLHVTWEFYMAKWCHISKGRYTRCEI